jgi:hypothetical protein
MVISRGSLLRPAFISCLLGDGEFGLVKHLFLFEVLFDISLLITITSGLAYSSMFPAMMSWIRSKQSAGGCRTDMMTTPRRWR